MKSSVRSGALERLPVRVGLGAIERLMTVAEARRYGDREMPRDLKRAGFETCVFLSDPEIHGARYIRVSYGK